VKIKVVRNDGSVETLSLTFPLSGKSKMIVSADGTEHFFLEDGTYDGWGRPILHGSEVRSLVEAAILFLFLLFLCNFKHA